MQNIQYSGEHIWIYYVGHFLLLTAFFSAVFVVFSFWKWNKEIESTAWLKSLRYSFYLHSVSLIGIIVLIVSMMYFHLFEFQYVWAHVSDELPQRYILAAFWEGQEGSFLLWMFWNIVLALFFVRSNTPLRMGVLTTIMLMNAILMTMILGVYVFDAKIGSNPFVLLRHTMDIPIFRNAEYTSLIKGNGLNPLLQNYWMIIHPPTLFLGFASTVVPFAFALSALHFRNYKEWLKPCLSWSLFSAGILGTGILMGGAWAYEALSFGGYWAWDPVENMSLVPWLVLLAGVHLNLIAIHTSYSLRPAILFYFLSFILVVYSSFLTRSGILGDSSAHAFTQMGLEWQLVGFLAIVTILPLVYFIIHYKSIPSLQSEERLASKEFWMFMGSLVLLFSAGLMSFTTSIPVYNKILDVMAKVFNTSFVHLHRTSPLDPISHHNNFQIWIGILIGILSGMALYLRYIGERKILLPGKFWKTFVALVLVSMGFTYGLGFNFETLHWSHTLFLFAGVFGIIASIWYLISTIKWNMKLSASVFSHAGFGVLLLGIIFSGLNKRYISNNVFAQLDLTESESKEELLRHITLIRGEKMFMNGYWVNYKQDTFIDNRRIYTIDFNQEDSLGAAKESFTVYPEIQYDNKLTKVAASNPSIQRRWNKDIFTLIAQIPISQMDAESAKKTEDSLRYETYILKLGDTVYTQKHFVVLKRILTDFPLKDFTFEPHDKKFQFEYHVGSLDDDSIYIASPSIIFRNQLVYKFPDNIDRLSMRFQLVDSIYDVAMRHVNHLKYQSLTLKKGDSIQVRNGGVIQLIDFKRDASRPDFQPQENDIAVAAILSYKKDTISTTLDPIYVIRDNKSFSIPVHDFDHGVSIQFTKIDPKTENMEFEFAEHPFMQIAEFPLEISENAARTDYIVMEAFEYPGISLVWLGSILMVTGLFLGSYYRKKYPR